MLQSCWHRAYVSDVVGLNFKGCLLKKKALLEDKMLSHNIYCWAFTRQLKTLICFSAVTSVDFPWVCKSKDLSRMKCQCSVYRLHGAGILDYIFLSLFIDLMLMPYLLQS